VTLMHSNVFVKLQSDRKRFSFEALCGRLFSNAVIYRLIHYFFSETEVIVLEK